MSVKAIRFKGSLLIPFSIYQERAGYFTGEIVDGKLILTTFLFLTNNNTPEGEEIYKQYELTRIDKDYLSINKLSSFVASDIAQNPEARNFLLRQAVKASLK